MMQPLSRKINQLTGLKSVDLDFSEDCVYAKHNRASSPSSTTNISNVTNLIHFGT